MCVRCKTNCIQLVLDVIHFSLIQHILFLINLRVTNFRIFFAVEYTNNYISPMKICYNTSFTLPKQSKNLDPSHKPNLDFWVCF